MQDALGMFGGGVPGAVVVHVERGDRGDRHDQTVTRGDQSGQ